MIDGPRLSSSTIQAWTTRRRPRPRDLHSALVLGGVAGTSLPSGRMSPTASQATP